MPPPDTIPRLTDSDGVSPRVRRGFNQMADAVNSLLRSTELQRTKANEWTIGGGASIDSNLSVAGFFPRYLPGPVAYVTAPNAFLAPQSVTVVNKLAPALTLQITSQLAVGEAVLVVESPAGAQVFAVDVEGDVFAREGVFGGNVVVSGEVTAASFTGDGSKLTGVALLADDNTFTLGPNQFRTGGNANVGVRILQNSGSQTANLFELANSAGTALASFNSDASRLTMPSAFGIGSGTTFNATLGTAVGTGAAATGSQSTAVGASAVTSGANAVAVGINAVASKTGAVAIGVNASATVTNGIAIGNTATCSQANAAAVGGGLTLAADEFVWGNIQGLGAVAHFRLTGHSSVQARSMYRLTTSWTDSTDASRTVRAVFGVNDFNAATAPREGLRLDSNGTGCTTTIGGDSTFQGCVVNEAGADADSRIEGDTATHLFVCDAGLDAVQVGTTTAGVIADFRSAAIVFNENGADRDFRVEGDTDVNLLFTDASADRVGVGTNAPAALLHVAGTTRTNGLRLTAAAELTIAAGAVTRTQSFHRIDTEADAATDDLDTINGGTEGDILVLRAENSARDVVVKDGTGNLQLAGGDFTLDHAHDTITLIYDGSNWIEMCRSNNSA